jgi:glycosyltransferase involved in cell wall biosynthesis
MRVGFVSFRLAGTDGVSLETAKLAQIFHRLGHEIFYFAGELDPESVQKGLFSVPIAGRMLVEAAHFTHPEVQWITHHAFGTEQAATEFEARLQRLAGELADSLRAFVENNALDLIIPQNVLALPMNLALSMAVKQVILERGLPAIAHHHDFYWERSRYDLNCVGGFLQDTFPPNLPNMRHLVINVLAQRVLAERGIQSRVLPNILDFAVEPPGPDDFNATLRADFGVRDGDLLFLQPTRVIRRKGIELSIELVRRLADLPIKLLVSHYQERDSQDYLDEMKALALHSGVALTHAPERFAPYRGTPGNGQKLYRLWDAYVHADFVTYPSLYEGWGNALLEAIYLRRPLLVNRYRVYREDIEPVGIRAVTIDGAVTDVAIEQVRGLLRDPAAVAEMTEHNARVAAQHFSYDFAQALLEEVLHSFERAHG